MKFLFSLISISLVFFVSIEAQKRDLTVHISTWNVNEKNPPLDLVKFLGQDTKIKPDILIIGLQEVTMSIVKAAVNAIASDEWSKTLKNTLQKQYVHVATEATMGIVLNIFVKTEHSSTLNGVDKQIEKTGLGGGLVGNKGGVIVKFNLYNHAFCIVNAHFHAHDDGNDKRIVDFNTINKAREKLCKNKSDYIFWSGDLNFRIEQASLTAEKILATINKGQHLTMLPYDQLTMTKKAGKIFNGFNEAKLTFKPTYKMVIDKGGYNLQRKPAWTDRILFKSDTNKPFTTIFYRSLDNFITSDHNPVQGQFKINV